MFSMMSQNKKKILCQTSSSYTCIPDEMTTAKVSVAFIIFPESTLLDL